MIDASDIRWALRKKYAPPEFAVCFEVGDGVGGGGFMNVHRHLDAIVMNLYPSRAFSLSGFEIKVDRQDLRRELASPEKSDAVAKYLDAFYIVYPESLNILDLEIPVDWGLMSCNDDLVLQTVKAAEKIEAIPPTRSFLAALFRAVDAEEYMRVEKTVKEQMEALENGYAARVEHAVQVAKDLQRHEHAVRIEWAENLIADLKSAGFDWKDLRWHEPAFARAVKTAITHQSMSLDRVERACVIMEQCVVDVRAQMDHLKPVV